MYPHKHIIGLTGYTRANKGDLGARLFRALGDYQQTCTRVSMPLLIRGILEHMHKDVTRDNMARISRALESEWPNLISEYIEARVAESHSRFIVIEGIVRQSEVDLLRTYTHNYLVGVHASKYVCWHRVRHSSEEYYKGQSKISWKEFQKLLATEPESNIPSLMKQADFRFSNTVEGDNGQHFEAEFQKLWKRLEPKLFS